MKTKMQMNCPNCQSTISVDELLISQFEKSIKADLQTELSERYNELNEKQEEYKTLFQKLSRERENIDQLVNSRVKSQLHQQEESLKQSIRKEIDDERSLQLQQLEDELVKKSAQLKELNGTKTQLVRLQREMEEKETAIILQKEQEFTERLQQARTSIQEQIHQEHFLKLKEREKVIEDLKTKLDEAKRKAEQGSMQLQGEVQELEIIELLHASHPYDEISQSKKGANAADVLQIVRTQHGAECGKIYYESKRTKSWSNDWVKKFKQDNLNAKADILVLVTNTLPHDIQRYGIVDGVWVCGFNDVKELSLVLRYGLLKLQQVALTHQGKESKMEMLYNYLTSEDFKNIFESILISFKSIQDSHHSEKLKMQRLWKEREKMFEQALASTVDFYGTIKGISSAIPDVQLLSFREAV